MQLVDGGSLFQLHFFFFLVRILESDVISASVILFSCKCTLLFNFLFKLCPIQFLGWKIQQDATMYQNFIIPYIYEAQHVSGDMPPIIRSLRLHRQSLVLHMWKVVGRAVVERQVAYTSYLRSFDILQGLYIYRHTQHDKISHLYLPSQLVHIPEENWESLVE